MTVTPLKQLNPIEMIDPGQVTSVTGTAYVAGVLPIKVGIIKIFNLQ